MAYRRKPGVLRGSTSEVVEDIGEDIAAEEDGSSLAAKAIKASSAHRDSSLFSAYRESALASASRLPNLATPSSPSTEDTLRYDDTSRKNLKESKYGFWGLLAKKAKAILDDDNVAQPSGTYGRNKPQSFDTATKVKQCDPHHLHESHKRMGNPTVQKGLDAIASSLNYISGTISNALEEGLTAVENQAADIIQETRKLRNRRKGSPSQLQNATSTRQQPRLQIHLQSHLQADHETQLKASRDVAMAMAAKAKLLLRELKTVKADLAFAKERCAQLEEENKILRESREKGESPEDDDLIRLQLETLLAEKARLAHENSVYARENRFLREVVEYHQLTMQDVVYLDEGIEEVTEVSPIMAKPQPIATTAPHHGAASCAESS